MPITRDRQDDSSPKAVTHQFDRGGFIAAFGNCFRNGAKLAAQAFDAMPPFAIDSALVFSALQVEFRATGSAEKLEILKAYTPLDPGTKAARIVAEESQSDGLRAMTADQQRKLLQLLAIYSEKFGFDAIFVVRNYTTSELLAALEARVVTAVEIELQTTYREVEKLAKIQVEAYFAAAGHKAS